MADMVIAQPLFIGMIIIIVLLLIGIFAAIYKVVMYMADMKANAPEAFVIKEAREKRLPILALHDAGSGKTILKLGKKSRKFDWEFEVGEYGPKVTPEHTPDCEPDMLGGNLPIYHYDIKSISACSPRSAAAVCNLSKLRSLPEFELLRFLQEDDLYTLLREDAANLEHDCKIYLQDYAYSNIGQPIPDSVSDFVALVQSAREVFSAEDWDDSDSGYIYVSLEPEKEKPIAKVVEKSRQGFASLLEKFKKREHEESEVTDSTEDIFEEFSYQMEEPAGTYEMAYRIPCKLEPFSFKYAFRCIGIANEAVTVRNLLELARMKGFEDGKNGDSKLITVGICALLILIGGAFACVIGWRLVGGA